jgi:hypothetical protein
LSSTKTAKRLATSYKRTVDIVSDKAAVNALYEAMKAACKPMLPKSLGAIGAEGLLSTLNHKGQYWYKQAAILHDGKPYLFEILIAQTPGAGDCGFMINHAMVFGDFLSGFSFVNFTDDTQGFGINGLLYFIDPKNITVIAHMMGVGLVFKDYGKGQLDLPRTVIAEIRSKIELAGKTLEKSYKARIRNHNAWQRHQKELEKTATWKRKDAVLELLPEAIALATDCGTLPCNVRGLYYKVRPLLQGYTDEELGYNYFSQALWPAYCRSNGKNPLIYNDSRGILVEPHSDGTFQLGTFDVRDYVIPDYHYNKILFIEKKGLLQIFIAANLHKRYDMALIGSEGYATEAIRVLLDKMQTGENYTIFVLHDADPHGYNISRTLQEATRRMPNHSIDVIDIGLTIGDAVAMRLEPETFKRKKELPADLTLTPQELEYFAGEREDNMWKGCRRFELNAMGSRELIEYVEKAIDASGAAIKVIPPVSIQTTTANNALAGLIDSQVDKQLEALFKITDLKSRLIEQFAFDQQNFNVADYLAKNPVKTWKSGVIQQVIDLFENLSASVNAAIKMWLF